MNTGSALADKRGLGGSFFTGVLAVVVASPCTAPFMGTALGFAVTQPPLVGIIRVCQHWGPAWRHPCLYSATAARHAPFMPAPGPWMETLKQLLAFPLYATAIWLLWVAGRQTGVNTMAVGPVRRTAAGTRAVALAPGNCWRRGLAGAMPRGRRLALASLRGTWIRRLAAGSHALAKAINLPWTESEVADPAARGQPGVRRCYRRLVHYL